MITLQQALADQEDIEDLCRPIEGRVSYEYFTPNDSHGFASVIKTYAGYPIEEPIYATFPHGIYLMDRVLPVSELKISFPAHLNYPGFTDHLWEKAAIAKKIIPFASPIHYALKQFKCEVKPEDRRGTLYMPMHSSHVWEIDLDIEAVTKELRDLPEEFHPITVCVHWIDVEKNQHKKFKELGFEVVSAGHHKDPNFIYRWLHLLTKHKLAAHSGIGSCLFYAISAGIPFYMTNQEGVMVKNEEYKHTQLMHRKGRQFSKEALKRMKKMKFLFKDFGETITSKQQEMVDLYTRKDCVLSPDEMLELLNSIKDLALSNKTG